MYDAEFEERWRAYHEAKGMYDLVSSKVPARTQRVATATTDTPMRSGIGSMNMANHEIKNINYYQQLLNSGPYNASQRKYIQDVINSVKKQNNIATQRQIDLLNRLKTGDFNFGPKGRQEGGVAQDNDVLELELTPEEIDWYLANGYEVEDIG